MREPWSKSAQKAIAAYLIQAKVGHALNAFVDIVDRLYFKSDEPEIRRALALVGAEIYISAQMGATPAGGATDGNPTWSDLTLANLVKIYTGESASFLVTDGQGVLVILTFENGVRTSRTPEHLPAVKTFIAFVRADWEIVQRILVTAETEEEARKYIRALIADRANVRLLDVRVHKGSSFGPRAGCSISIEATLPYHLRALGVEEIDPVPDELKALEHTATTLPPAMARRTGRGRRRSQNRY